MKLVVTALVALVGPMLVYNTYKLWFVPMLAEEDIIDHLVAHFTKNVLADYPEPGHTKRDAHPKHIGVVKGEFVVDPKIASQHQIGVFAHPGKSYPCLIRVSNGGFGKEKPDFEPSIKGFAIKLMDEKNSSKSLGQDFILISTERTSFGTSDAIHNGLVGGNLPLFFFDMLCSGNFWDLYYQVFATFSHVFDHVLGIPFWSNTPYAFGLHEQVKYHVKPTSPFSFSFPKVIEGKETDINYLSARMKSHLQQEEATFDFFVQFRSKTQPQQIDDLARVWSQKLSPWTKLATVRIFKQDFAVNDELAEELSFSPGHALEEHEALGRVNRVRIGVYKKMQKLRHERDGRRNVE